MNTGLALWLIFEFVFSLYFVFLKFWVRIFFVFCIFEIVDSYFFVYCIFEIVDSYCFLYFVFLGNCIRIFFVFLYVFVFFCKHTKKIRNNPNKIQKKYTLYFCIFFVCFHYVQTCNLYFCIFFIFPVLHRLHFVLLYFLRSLDMA